MSMFARAALVFSAVCAAPLAASAQDADKTETTVEKKLIEPNNWEVSTGLGFHLMSDSVELGVPDFIDTAHPETGPLFGLRGLFKFRKDFGVEGELTITPTSASISGDSITVFGWRVHLVVPLGYKFWRFESQLVAGFGGISTTGDGRHRAVDEIASDTDPLFHWGVTGRIRLNDTWHLRGDARHLLAPSTDRNFPFTNNFEFSAGVAYRFGGGARIRPSVGTDRDSDGVSDADDKCPGQKEDVDGFEDGDGCPEVDNDNDGIRDPEDLCPQKAETVNQFEDLDGCPDEAPAPVPEETPPADGGAIPGTEPAPDEIPAPKDRPAEPKTIPPAPAPSPQPQPTSAVR